MTATAALAECPERPVEFVIPFPPGDRDDGVTRMIADKFREMYGVPAAVVINPAKGHDKSLHAREKHTDLKSAWVQP